MIKLSNRLKRISDYVSDNVSLVDIGCDHALLDIYLCQNRKNIKIIASDINENALKGARSNIKKEHLEDKIEVRCSNGLDKIEKDEIDTIVVSGMGSHTIIGIFHANLSKLKNVKSIIIQSNNHEYFLRKKMCELGYYIEDESLVKEGNIIYTIILFKKGYRYYSYKSKLLGPILLKTNSDLFKEKCSKELEKLRYIYSVIPKKNIIYKLKTKYKIRMLESIK